MEGQTRKVCPFCVWIYKFSREWV